ncbi:DUF4012 domain-containing protein [Patescibacteria group bacterium]|nr:DUF4012 domain-containing protein [Patescibacteria group bacterium]
MADPRPSRPRRTMHDIRKPVKPGANFPYPLPETYSARRMVHAIRKRLTRKALLTALGILAGGYLIMLAVFAHSAWNAVETAKNALPELRAAAEHFDTGAAVAKLDTISQTIDTATQQAELSGISVIASVLGIVIPPLREVPPLLSNIATLNTKTLALANDINELKTGGIAMVMGRHGSDLIDLLTRTDADMKTISATDSALSAQSDQLGRDSATLASLIRPLTDKYMTINSHLAEAENFLDSLIALLRQPGEVHLALLLQNPTEIRPGGGFLGSFGDIVLQNGSLEAVHIDDIYNADRQLTVKVLPPPELAGITPTWGARDANWFFDFPTSAQKVMDLLQASQLFQQPQQVTFQGAIAVNTNVLQSILAATGPVTLDHYGLTVTADNFLPELQREVETGPDKKPGQNPKRILSVLAPILMQRLQALSDTQRSDLIGSFANQMKNKDIMVYFTDWYMENFMQSAGIAGNVMQLQPGQPADYLAVVDANVAGGKTDAEIAQDISLNSALQPDGSVANQLAVTRTYSDAGPGDWWYHVPDTNYMKVLVPQYSRLLSLSGETTAPRTPTPLSGAMTDTDLLAIRQTNIATSSFTAFAGQEFGKFSFGAWLTTNPGTHKTLTMSYEEPAVNAPADGGSYTFIFEKQSGVPSALTYTVTAPQGYLWKESGGRTYRFTAADTPAREIIQLTLQKAS